MSNPDSTIIFSDLEGTLLNEENGTFDPQKFQTLLNKIHQFVTKTSTLLHFAIVSPVEVKFLKPILEELEDEFHKFNKLNNTNYRINIAACYDDRSHDMDRLPNNILPMLKIEDGNEVGKKRIVDYLTDSLGYRFNIKYAVYMGNGRNDIASMKFLRNMYRDNAFIVCPENSRTEIKNNSTYYAGKGEDLDGLISGFDKVLSVLNKRLNTQIKSHPDSGAGSEPDL